MSKRALLSFLGALMAFPASGLRADQPPSAKEQENYQVVEQAMVAAINAYRAAQLPLLEPLVPLTELCGAARLEAEDHLTHPGSQIVVMEAQSLGYTGGFGGVGDGSLYLSPESFIQALLTDANPTYRNDILDPNAKFVGVGVAVRASGATSDVEWTFCIGENGVGPAPYGTTGIETASGRGLPDLGQLASIFGGGLSGDSINGFLYAPGTALTPAVVQQFTKALGKLLKKPPGVSASVGQPVTFVLPKAIFQVVQALKVKGALPPGVKFDAKRGRFHGTPTKVGTYKLRLKGSLKGEVNGSMVLPTLRVIFKVEG